MSSDHPSTRPRFSFSLRGLITTIVVVAVVGNIIVQALVIIPLRKEVRRLREETGQLLIDDPTKLQAIQIETDQDFVWKWRVWIPGGRSVAVSTRVAEVSAEGLPADAGGMSCSSMDQGREEIITVRLQKSLDGTLKCALSVGGRTAFTDVPSGAANWLMTTPGATRTSGVRRRTTEEEQGKPFILLRHRVFYDGRTSDGGPPTDGIMVWLHDEV